VVLKPVAAPQRRGGGGVVLKPVAVSVASIGYPGLRPLQVTVIVYSGLVCSWPVSC
jgi:hypothetical protein